MKANEVVSLALVESSRSLQIGHFDAFIPQEDPNVDKKANDEFVEEEPTVSFIDNELKKQNICRWKSTWKKSLSITRSLYSLEKALSRLKIPLKITRADKKEYYQNFITN